MKWLYLLVGLSLAAAFGLLWFGEWIFLLPGCCSMSLPIFLTTLKIGMIRKPGMLSLVLGQRSIRLAACFLPLPWHYKIFSAITLLPLWKSTVASRNKCCS